MAFNLWWDSRQANDAVAFERSIFSKNHDYNIYRYKIIFCAAVNTYVGV